ncbi:AGAP005269-PA-like protein [Anopheles sinensis]|uniref:AGAP005269-PA-like protein n=1 Tax=Anopheles sinensis TaxID=74873 RepID=A0A084WJH8_ANOSI|nr:AGAP005269-PA-like protein [Anopheles sinensis]
MERFAINIIHQQIQNICRLCGVDNPHKLPIIDEDEVICLDDDETPLVKKIEECVGIKVSKNDQMPQQICTLCIDKVNDFYEYRSMCAATNIQTRTFLNLPIIEPKSVVVKPTEVPATGVSEPPVTSSDSKANVKRGAKTRARKNDDDADTKEFLGVPTEKRIKTEHACQYCNDVFDTSPDLERHLVTKHTPLIRKYGCGTCCELFDTAAEYRDHNLWHKLSRTPYYCFRCKRRFAKSGTLNKHLLLNACARLGRKTEITLVPDMRCKLCNKVFKTQNLYEWHSCFLRARANCPKCGKYYTQKKQLTRHYMRFCKANLPPLEPSLVVKEEPITPASGGLGAHLLVPPTAVMGKEVRKRGRPPGPAALNRMMQEMKEESTELPFPPLLDPPELKSENTSVDGNQSGQTPPSAGNAEGESRKRSKVTFEQEADRINSLLRTGAEVNENSDLAEISSMLTSVNEAIATISNVKKKKKHKHPGIPTAADNNAERPAEGAAQLPMVMLSMANIKPEVSENSSTPQEALAAPSEENEQNGPDTIATNMDGNDEVESNADNAEGTNEEDDFAGYDDNETHDNMERDDSGPDMDETTRSADDNQGEEAESSISQAVETNDDAAGTIMPSVQVKQEPMAYHSDSEADAGDYQMAMSCLAIKQEHVEEDSATVRSAAEDVPGQSQQREKRKNNQNGYQALRIKIKKEKGLLNATVVGQEPDPIETPPAPDGATTEPPERRTVVNATVVGQEPDAIETPPTPDGTERPERPTVVSKPQKKPTKKANTPNHFKVRPMRVRPAPIEDTEEVIIKQERPDPEHEHNQEHEQNDVPPPEEEPLGGVRVKQEPLDSLSEHSNHEHPGPSRSSQESLNTNRGNDEEEIAFDGIRIKRERHEERAMTMWAAAARNGTGDEQMDTQPSMRHTTGNVANEAEQSLSRINKRVAGSSGASGSASRKSSKRINPFALLKQKSLAMASAPQILASEQSDPNVDKLPIIAQVASIDPDERLTGSSDSNSIDGPVAGGNEARQTPTQASDENEADKEDQAASATLVEPSLSGTKSTTVENVVAQRGFTELRIASVATVQEDVALSEKTRGEAPRSRLNGTR